MARRDASTTGPSADEINGSIRLIAIKHRAMTAEAFAPLGLHPGQEAVLFAIRDAGPSTQAAIGAAIGCEPSSVTGMVQKLESAGYISRSRAERDGRALLVDLTDRGRDLLPALSRAWRRVADETTRGMSPARRVEVAAVLGQVAAVLTGTSPDDPPG